MAVRDVVLLSVWQVISLTWRLACLDHHLGFVCVPNTHFPSFSRSFPTFFFVVVPIKHVSRYWHNIEFRGCRKWKFNAKVVWCQRYSVAGIRWNCMQWSGYQAYFFLIQGSCKFFVVQDAGRQNFFEVVNRFSPAFHNYPEALPKEWWIAMRVFPFLEVVLLLLVISLAVSQLLQSLSMLIDHVVR